MSNYLRVKDWEKFQHYKDRNPPWIKLDTQTFSNYDFGRLQDASKLLAVCIWTLASRYKDPKLGLIPNDFEYIKRQCNLGDFVKVEHLKELINQGYVIDDSKLLADCKQSARPETEAEAEAETEENKIILQKNNFSLRPPDVTSQTWLDFTKLRKEKKSSITSTALLLIRKQAELADFTMEEALQECCTRGWAGFKAKWVIEKNGNNYYEKKFATKQDAHDNFTKGIALALSSTPK